jgi:hypothetical protein
MNERRQKKSTRVSGGFSGLKVSEEERVSF